jgi:hypothetical protein
MADPEEHMKNLNRALNSLPRRSGIFVSLAVALSAAACSTEPGTVQVAGSQPMAAPEQYRSWWSATEQCSGLSGDFSKLEFYQVPGVSTFASPVGTVVGLWNQAGSENRITLAGYYLDNELVVRHEMLHALLERTGHPVEYFVTRCGLTWDSWPAHNGVTGGAPALD